MEMEREKERVKPIIDKNDFKFTKIDTNLFSLTFEITNDNIVLPMIINFDLINLIYSLNPSIFASVKMDKIENELVNNNLEEANISALLKDIFYELGLPQYYFSINIKKIDTKTNAISITPSNIRFICKTTKNILLLIPADSESLPIQQIDIVFNIVTNHYVKVKCDISLVDDHNLPQFTEKIIGNTLYNIFNKVKQFIENIAFNI
jgi:hypothetical protein